MRHRTMALVLSATLLLSAFAASCTSGSDEPVGSQVAVGGAPLMITDPGLTQADDGSTVVIGTLSNVTERTVEVVGASSSVGSVSFRSSSGPAMSFLVEPNADFTLSIDGNHLVLDDTEGDVTVAEVTLQLDIEDEFTFRAEPQLDDEQ